MVDLCVVELSEGGVTLPSGLAAGGVVCFVSEVEVEVCSDVVVDGDPAEGVTTVVGGVCWHPASIRLIATAPKSGTHL